jgi:hypothetical protein
MSRRIAIIGGGISGITSAIKLAKSKNNQIDVFEKRPYILKGPPYCHLHAGGILYPEISLQDSQQLMADSIEFANYFPSCLDYRPTIVAYRSTSKYSTKSLIFKCKVNKVNYQFSKYNYLLGKVKNFYAVYDLSDMTYFKKFGKLPQSDDIGRDYHDPYVEQFCKLITDIYSIKYPFVSVCEPGIIQSKVEKQLEDELKTFNNINIITDISVEVKELNNYNTIINASGKDLFNNNTDEIYELKSSWVIKSPLITSNMPEIAIIGERETDNGMIQITPLDYGLFQIHCMTNHSTIINTFNKSNVPLTITLQDKEIQFRSHIAIQQIAKMFPIFTLSKIEYACPGIQRIPYYTKSKRTSEITIQEKDETTTYIDIITLKACSVVSLVNKLILN